MTAGAARLSLLAVVKASSRASWPTTAGWWTPAVPPLSSSRGCASTSSYQELLRAASRPLPDVQSLHELSAVLSGWRHQRQQQRDAQPADRQLEEVAASTSEGVARALGDLTLSRPAAVPNYLAAFAELQLPVLPEAERALCMAVPAVLRLGPARAGGGGDDDATAPPSLLAQTLPALQLRSPHHVMHAIADRVLPSVPTSPDAVRTHHLVDLLRWLAGAGCHHVPLFRSSVGRLVADRASLPSTALVAALHSYAAVCHYDVALFRELCGEVHARMAGARQRTLLSFMHWAPSPPQAAAAGEAAAHDHHHHQRLPLGPLAMLSTAVVAVGHHGDAGGEALLALVADEAMQQALGMLAAGERAAAQAGERPRGAAVTAARPQGAALPVGAGSRGSGDVLAQLAAAQVAAAAGLAPAAAATALADLAWSLAASGHATAPLLHATEAVAAYLRDHVPPRAALQLLHAHVLSASAVAPSLCVELGPGLAAAMHSAPLDDVVAAAELLSAAAAAPGGLGSASARLHHDLCDALCCAAVAQQHGMTPSTAARLVVAMARLGHYDAALWGAAVDLLLGRQQGWGPRQGQGHDVFESPGTLPGDAGGAGAGGLAALPTRDVAAVAWAAGAVGHRFPALLDALAALALDRSDDMPLVDLAAVLWALAVLDYAPGGSSEAASLMYLELSRRRVSVAQDGPQLLLACQVHMMVRAGWAAAAQGPGAAARGSQLTPAWWLSSLRRAWDVHQVQAQARAEAAAEAHGLLGGAGADPDHEAPMMHGAGAGPGPHRASEQQRRAFLADAQGRASALLLASPLPPPPGAAPGGGGGWHGSKKARVPAGPAPAQPHSALPGAACHGVLFGGVGAAVAGAGALPPVAPLVSAPDPEAVVGLLRTLRALGVRSDAGFRQEVDAEGAGLSVTVDVAAVYKGQHVALLLHDDACFAHVCAARIGAGRGAPAEAAVAAGAGGQANQRDKAGAGADGRRSGDAGPVLGGRHVKVQAVGLSGGAGAPPGLLGPYAWRWRLLQRLGWLVVHVPCEEWQRLGAGADDRARREYVAALLDRTVT